MVSHSGVLFLLTTFIPFSQEGRIPRGNCPILQIGNKLVYIHSYSTQSQRCTPETARLLRTSLHSTDPQGQRLKRTSSRRLKHQERAGVARVLQLPVQQCLSFLTFQANVCVFLCVPFSSETYSLMFIRLPSKSKSKCQVQHTSGIKGNKPVFQAVPTQLLGIQWERCG